MSNPYLDNDPTMAFNDRTLDDAFGPDTFVADDPSTHVPPAHARTAGPKQAESAYDVLSQQTGIDPLLWLNQLRANNEDIFQARKAVAEQKAHLARLEAEHQSLGVGSLWDHTRKSLLAQLGEAYRAELEKKIEAETADGGKAVTKITESGLDAHAHAHPRYVHFIESARDERLQYAEGRAKLEELWATVNHLEGVKEYLTQRIRLNEEMIRYNRALSNLGS